MTCASQCNGLNYDSMSYDVDDYWSLIDLSWIEREKTFSSSLFLERVEQSTLSIETIDERRL